MLRIFYEQDIRFSVALCATCRIRVQPTLLQSLEVIQNDVLRNILHAPLKINLCNLRAVSTVFLTQLHSVLHFDHYVQVGPELS